jgi:hypothetical protein
MKSIVRELQSMDRRTVIHASRRSGNTMLLIEQAVGHASATHRNTINIVAFNYGQVKYIQHMLMNRYGSCFTANTNAFVRHGTGSCIFVTVMPLQFAHCYFCDTGSPSPGDNSHQIYTPIVDNKVTMEMGRHHNVYGRTVYMRNSKI